MSYIKVKGGSFIFHIPDIKLYLYHTRPVIYCYDTTNLDVILIKIVRKSKEQFMDKQFEGSNMAKRLFAMVGRLSTEYFEPMVFSDMLHNFTITI